MNDQLAINVCGPVGIALNGQPLKKFRSRKAMALIVYISCVETWQQREQLADLLWDASSTKQSLSNLRTVLSMVREQIADHIFSNQTQIGICPQSKTTVDYLALSKEFREMPRNLDAHAALRLEKILLLYRGEFLQDFVLNDAPRFSQWVGCIRHTLHTAVLCAYQELASYHLGNHDFATGIRVAHRWLQCDPIDEAGHAILIEMLTKSGHHKAASDQYAICQKLLHEELNVEPASEIKEMVVGLS